MSQDSAHPLLEPLPCGAVSPWTVCLPSVVKTKRCAVWGRCTGRAIKKSKGTISTNQGGLSGVKDEMGFPGFCSDTNVLASL